MNNLSFTIKAKELMAATNDEELKTVLDYSIKLVEENITLTYALNKMKNAAISNLKVAESYQEAYHNLTEVFTIDEDKVKELDLALNKAYPF